MEVDDRHLCSERAYREKCTSLINQIYFRFELFRLKKLTIAISIVNDREKCTSWITESRLVYFFSVCMVSFAEIDDHISV